MVGTSTDIVTGKLKKDVWTLVITESIGKAAQTELALIFCPLQTASRSRGGPARSLLVSLHGAFCAYYMGTSLGTRGGHSQPCSGQVQYRSGELMPNATATKSNPVKFTANLLAAGLPIKIPKLMSSK